MSAPDRIWIDAWGGNWSSRTGGTQKHEYVRRDPAVLAALPEVRALVDAETERCAKVAERFGPDRPLVETRPRDRIIGRWEGEQAASANIAAVSSKVKPLVWEEPCARNNQCHIARSIFGEYYVHIDGGRHQAWLEANSKPYENAIGEVVGSVYAAQALAQADYEARIMSALDLTPAALRAIGEPRNG